jgi:hypothetical protein
VLKRSGFGTTNALSSSSELRPQGNGIHLTTDHPARLSVLSAEAQVKRYPRDDALSTGYAAAIGYLEKF